MAAVRPAWTVDEVGRDWVGALVARIERLPLTIEMAAARLGSMTFDELERAVGAGMSGPQMTHRTPAKRHRTPAKRHRTLESLVAWSAGLLSDDEQRTFTELPVFAGAVSADDAGAVLTTGEPIEVTDAETGSAPMHYMVNCAHGRSCALTRVGAERGPRRPLACWP